MTQTVTARRKPRLAERAANAAAGLTLRGMPHIPEAVKRLLLGGRAITIDGNTLDTTLQLMLTLSLIHI